MFDYAGGIKREDNVSLLAQLGDQNQSPAADFFAQVRHRLEITFSSMMFQNVSE